MHTPISTRWLHVVFVFVLLAFATSAVAQWFLMNTSSAVAPKVVVRHKAGLRALPGFLPQGRLYCADESTLGYMRLHPEGFEKISREETLEFGKNQVEVACADSWSSDSCKEAQATLALLRKSVKLCW
jgi:hypothetical protein